MGDLKEDIKQLFASSNLQVDTINLGYENTNDIFEVSSDEGCCIANCRFFFKGLLQSEDKIIDYEKNVYYYKSMN